jgi:homogentisate 1,2-dioxygenase
MTNWIRLPNSEGQCVSRPDGQAGYKTYQREVGRAGFQGPSAQIYHRHPPAGWATFEGPLRPRAFYLQKLSSGPACPLQARRILHNDRMELRYWKTESKMQALARNADGDILLFVHDGAGELFCDYGHLSYRDGDYILLPRGTAWRIEPAGMSEFLMIEATGDAVVLPDPSSGGDAVVDPMLFTLPRIDDAFVAQQDEAFWEIHIKRRGQVSTLTYPFNPLDAIGWEGDLCVVKLNWRDLAKQQSRRQKTSPAASCTFVTDAFSVSTFIPKVGEGESGMLRVPFYHSNEDADEFIFYHRGEFFSRGDITAGMATFHPSGFPHGPHPNAYQSKMVKAPVETQEVAIMIDSRLFLDVDETIPGGAEWKAYVKTWEKAEETL